MPPNPTRLHVVSGKGGAGKSTVAAALALSLASRGRQVLLCEVEGRQGIAHIFGIGDLGATEVRIAAGLVDGGARESDAGSVFALHIDPEDALREYLATYFKLGPAARALEAFGVVEFATSIAPGLRDVLLTGKVYEATKSVRRGKNARTYDAVVLDAPPTGRIKQFLTANAELAGLAKMGPIKNQAESVMTTLRMQSAVHLVTLLEEMSVQETVEGAAELHAAELPVGTIVVNQARPRTLDEAQLKTARTGRIDASKVAASLAKVGLGDRAGMVDELVSLGADHAVRRELEDSQRAVLDDTDTSLVELPKFPGGVDLAALYDMAATLRTATQMTGGAK